MRGLLVSIGLVLLFLLAADAALRALRSRLPKTLPVIAKTLLNRAEQVLYGRLVRAFPGHVVLAQVALSQLLEVNRAHAAGHAQAIANRFRQLVADFVICAPDFSVVAVVELDGRSHGDDLQRERDERKDRFLQAVGLKLIRVPASDLPNEAALKALVAALPVCPASRLVRHAS